MEGKFIDEGKRSRAQLSYDRIEALEPGHPLGVKLRAIIDEAEDDAKTESGADAKL